MSIEVARWSDDAGPAWGSLLAADLNATAAHRLELGRALAAVLPGLRLEFVAVERQGALLGGAPVVIERRAGFHWIHGLPFTLSGAPLARAGEQACVDRAVATALAERAAALGAVGGAWVLYRPAGPAPEREALEAVPGETRWVTTAVIDLGAGLGPVWQAMDKKTRHELRRTGERGLRFAEDPESLDEVYALHHAQTRAWPGYRPLPIELARRLLQPAAATTPDAAPLARLFTVRDGRGVLAGGLVLDGPHESFVWWTGAHEDSRRAHGVAWLYVSLAEWAAAAGRSRLNLGASPGLEGVAAFKRSLGARDYRYPVRWIARARRSRLVSAVAAIQGFLRRGRPLGAPA
ncbi:MAG TPA: GNAT family N-acetyltransferase [Candidatus Limnocylindria bacterium]|nr:GNAT family N-acetyltransferase [Candidatus Limnocylindria bacterium]